MAGWYVRRGEKVIGPVDLAKLKESSAAGKLLPTDQLAKDAAGPWTEASRTTLFAKKPAEPPHLEPPHLEPPHLEPSHLEPSHLEPSHLEPSHLEPSHLEPSHLEPPPQSLVPEVEHPPLQDQPAKMVTVVRATNVFITSVARGTLAAGGAVVRSLSTRAQRRHELKLAKIQAQALADSRRPQAPATPTAPITFAPQMVQTTVVKVVNRKSGGCGCSGCGLILLLIVLAVLAAALYSNMNPSQQTRPQISEPGK